MNNRTLSSDLIRSFAEHLNREEKSTATMEKYLRDVRAFFAFTGKTAVTKELVLDYKRQLQEAGYALRSINSMLASLNSLFGFLGWQDCRVKFLRQQKQAYCPDEQELTRQEYLRLLQAAGQNTGTQLLLQTICATGIRVSELQFFTVEAVCRGQIQVDCKGKVRIILIPGKLRKLLLRYAQREGIRSGVIFRGRGGKPLSRTSIWAKMKQLCSRAGVESAKVFPHNLRKLFARTFYAMEKDIAKLADILGHSSIETTRIYIMTTGTEHRRKIDRMGLVV